MSSLLEKALAAHLAGNASKAEELFHEFVLQRASQVNESVVAGQAVDVDGIVEGKSYKKNDEDGEVADEKKKADKARKEGAAKKRDLDESEEAIEEGKTHKKNDDEDTESKKSKDQERKAGASKKRDLSEDESEEELEEGKTHKKNDDEDTASKKEKDKERKGSSKNKRDALAEAEELDDEAIEEGTLTATQGDDGTLTIVHEPMGDGASLLPPPVDMGGEIPADDLGDLPEIGGADDMGSMEDDMGVDPLGIEDPLPGPEDLTDEAFESLKESLTSELEKITMAPQEGKEVGDGTTVKGEMHSPVPNVSGEKRVAGTPVVNKGSEHNGFDREPTPKVDSDKTKSRNAMATGTASQSAVKK